jgi:hypothetical protein
MRLKDMPTQREQSLDSFLDEVRQMRGRMECLLPSYIAALHRLCQMPEEFERRFWISHIHALVQKVKADYKNYELQTQTANLFGKMTETMVNLAWQVTGQQPMAHTSPLQACLSLYPTGRIQPGLLGDVSKQYGAILISVEKFEAIVQRLEDRIMKGDILPKSEDEIPKLIYNLALKPPESLADRQA